MKMVRSHERREDTAGFKKEIQEVLVMCNEVLSSLHHEKRP